jgi:selenium-binding protein 1
LRNNRRRPGQPNLPPGDQLSGKVGDRYDLQHMGWNVCSSCHGEASKERGYSIVPVVRSSNLHTVDCVVDPCNPGLYQAISVNEIKEKIKVSGRDTVQCLGWDIIIAMLGDAKREAPGRFLQLNEDFEFAGRWEKDLGKMALNCDFWWQSRHSVMSPGNG